MPFGSGYRSKINENMVLSPGSFATYWLSVHYSVATAIGAELKKVFD